MESIQFGATWYNFSCGCSHGYTINISTITCQNDGTWGTTNPTCFENPGNLHFLTIIWDNL